MDTKLRTLLKAHGLLSTHFVYNASANDPYHDIGNGRVQDKQIQQVVIVDIGR